jgi:two-component system chemotaxis sensor kinase CheA
MTDTAFESLLGDFILDAKERSARVEEILLQLDEAEPGEQKLLLDEAKRELHTLKGNAGMMGLPELQKLAHEMEDDIVSWETENTDIQDILVKLDHFTVMLKDVDRENDGDTGDQSIEKSGIPNTQEIKRGSDIQGSVRVPFSSLDELVNLLAEMVIFRNRLTDAIFRGRSKISSDSAWEEVENAQEALGKTLTYIQEGIMRLRMVPLQSLFKNLKRIVHDEARKEGKEINFHTSGGETPIDKALMEIASEALGHIIRNAVIHGIELPDIRVSKGKARTGDIFLSATTQGNEVQIDIEDNGSGIRRQDLVESASKLGIELSAIDNLYSLLFLPGFTTKEGVDISAGRGIGLSAVTQSIQRMGGRIEVVSEEEKGSRFRIRLPLSVSITNAMILTVDNEMYALPLTHIIESVRFNSYDIHQVNHTNVFKWRGAVIPLLDIGCHFGTVKKPRNKGYIIVIEAGSKNRGLVIDDIVGIREIVVKGLDTFIGTPQGISGSTILGDGRVILILDPSGLSAVRPILEKQYEVRTN